jgi:hypothetical protein
MITPADLLNPLTVARGGRGTLGNGFRPCTLLGDRELVRAIADIGGNEPIRVAGSKARVMGFPRTAVRDGQLWGQTRTLGTFYVTALV